MNVVVDLPMSLRGGLKHNELIPPLFGDEKVLSTAEEEMISR
jgi:hypothetical protein